MSREARETLDAEDYTALLYAYAGIVNQVAPDNRYEESLDALVGELVAARTRENKLKEAINNADAFLADPSGDPHDAINFARDALSDVNE